MEINYDVILNYLVHQNIHKFISKKHILVSSDLFPEKFKLLLQNKFYRYGINQNNSFYNTILTLLNKDFITCNYDEEIEEVNNFIKLFSNSSDLLENIQSISDLLEINFIIFDFKNIDIYIIFCGIECNPYKVTLLIAQYEEYYEPIMYEQHNKRLFSYNDPIIKKIYNTDLKSYNTKIYKLNDNINTYINEFNNNTIFIKNNEYNINELLKMTKKELNEILKKKNITVNINKMLKKDIVNIILK